MIEDPEVVLLPAESNREKLASVRTKVQAAREDLVRDVAQTLRLSTVYRDTKETVLSS